MMGITGMMIHEALTGNPVRFRSAAYLRVGLLWLEHGLRAGIAGSAFWQQVYC